MSNIIVLHLGTFHIVHITYYDTTEKSYYVGLALDLDCESSFI